MANQDFFPEMVTAFPEADIPLAGLTSHLLQGDRHQFVFMCYEEDASVPEHSHEAQWGVVLDGRIRLTIDGTEYLLTKGDTYFIPKDVKHSAEVTKGYKDLTLFNQKDRYKLK